MLPGKLPKGAHIQIYRILVFEYLVSNLACMTVRDLFRLKFRHYLLMVPKTNVYETHF